MNAAGKLIFGAPASPMIFQENCPNSPMCQRSLPKTMMDSESEMALGL